ncbi:hypothetical protein KEM55_001353, partial [Ascosphaera atra]
LRLVRGSVLEEHVGRVQADLGVVAVDDRWQRAYRSLAVVDHRVHGALPDDVQVLAEVLVLFIEGHQLLAVHALGLVQGRELDVLGRARLVREGALDGVEVMRANGDQGTLAREVLVQLVLQGDEAVIAGLVEAHVAQDGAGDVGSYLGGLKGLA